MESLKRLFAVIFVAAVVSVLPKFTADALALVATIASVASLLPHCCQRRRMTAMRSYNPRVHNVRADVVAGSRWSPFIHSDRRAPLIVALETPAPDAADVRVVSHSGRRYPIRVEGLLADYHQAGADVAVTVSPSRPAVPVAAVHESDGLALVAPPVMPEAVPAPIAPMPEDMGVRVYVFRGRPCVIAAAVGRALGYAEKALISLIRSEWSAEMIEGKDFAVLKGVDLREFKALPDVVKESLTSAKAPNLGILYESGWDLVCIKTDKPEGQRLRRRLADEVLPKLRRGEPVAPVLPPASPQPQGLDAAMLAAAIAPFAETMNRALDTMNRAMAVLERVASGPARHDVAQYAPAPIRPAAMLPQPATFIPGGWVTASDIAVRLTASRGVTVSKNRVGRAIKAIGIRERGSAFACYRQVDSDNHGGVPNTVAQWFYNPTVMAEVDAVVFAPGAPMTQIPLPRI